jgi:hypothetical protein
MGVQIALIALFHVRMQEVGSLQLSPIPNHVGTLISDFQPPELV